MADPTIEAKLMEVDPASPAKEQDETKESQKAGASKTPGSTPRARRNRKQVEFFSPDPIGPDNEKLVVKEGNGTKLGEIPNVAFHLSKTLARDELLEDLHSLLYGRKGKAQGRKKAISEFSGFIADGDAEKQKEKDSERLGRWKVEHLNRLLDLLDLPRGSGPEGTKDSKVDRLMDFLVAPKQVSDKDLAAKEASKKAAAAKKRERAQKAKETGSKKRKGSTKPARSAKKAKKEGAAEEEGEREEEAGEESDLEEEEEEPAPKKKRASKGSSSNKKRSRGKKAEVAEEAEGEAEEEEEEQEEEDDTSWEGGLTKASLKQEVLKILEGANMDEFNLKSLMKQLEEKHSMDLSVQKPFIKVVAIQYCADQGPGFSGPAAAEPADKKPASPAKSKQQKKDKVPESKAKSAAEAHPKPVKAEIQSGKLSVGQAKQQGSSLHLLHLQPPRLTSA
ncbi:hypothetical protein WJX84_002597 [Apatococcus fuscideae]|uniref:DEK-C domain-containing protein n=1 Tax=Apatococcus fuscideae TaxID=2026836 RepID=A0AAW1STQ2_9CHLO